MQTGGPLIYYLSRGLLRAALGFYFTRIERFHPERVPARAPVLFTSNHPNSLTDAFVIGTSVPRKVNFVATVQLFQSAPVRWFLGQSGVIAVNRVEDDPRAMRSVLNTFEACFRVLEKGEAVGIFPEGITHDDPQLKEIKSGAARMALELEQRHIGKLGLLIVPVGLTFSAKQIYRSQVLVNFGEPIPAADFLSRYTANRHDGIRALSAEIERRIQGLILHLPLLERARIVQSVKSLYLNRLLVGNRVIHEPVKPRAEELLLTQAIAAAVDRTFLEHPDRAAEFSHKLAYYERLLKRLHLSDEVLAHFPGRTAVVGRSLLWAVLAIVGAPLAFYGWVHRLIPSVIIKAIVRKTTRRPPDQTQVSTATIISGLVVFTAFYALCVAVFHHFFNWRWTLRYAVSLPVASLAAYYYTKELRRFAASLRALFVLATVPSAGRRLAAVRGQLIDLIEVEREELAATAHVQ